MALSLTSDETIEELSSPYGNSQGDATLAEPFTVYIKARSLSTLIQLMKTVKSHLTAIFP